MEVVLSKKVGKYVPEVRWVASLSNGETIFEDRMPDLKPAWSRLAEYVEYNDLSITNLRAQFGPGKGEIKLPAGAEGYIQKKKAWFSSAGSGDELLGIGYIQGNLCLINYAGASGDSFTERGVPDPGEPFSIYRKDIRQKKAAGV